ncbi:hypothetical protein BKA63DRAFT_50422 [Paraphoma chrysanthemicola]|nr:hypothetical protein BKA63DRAFT_50422 [Paraphoma chrysanthemicola]
MALWTTSELCASGQTRTLVDEWTYQSATSSIPTKAGHCATCGPEAAESSFFSQQSTGLLDVWGLSLQITPNAFDAAILLCFPLISYFLYLLENENTHIGTVLFTVSPIVFWIFLTSRSFSPLYIRSQHLVERRHKPIWHCVVPAPLASAGVYLLQFFFSLNIPLRCHAKKKNFTFVWTL